MVTNDELIEILKSKIKDAESIAEEYAQEIGDYNECDKYLSKAEAYQEIIDLIINSQINSGLGF